MMKSPCAGDLARSRLHANRNCHSASSVDLAVESSRCLRPVDSIRNQTIGTLEAHERLSGCRSTLPVSEVSRQASAMPHQLLLIIPYVSAGDALA